jgi:hypothetical protein
MAGHSEISRSADNSWKDDGSFVTFNRSDTASPQPDPMERVAAMRRRLADVDTLSSQVAHLLTEALSERRKVVKEAILESERIVAEAEAKGEEAVRHAQRAAFGIVEAARAAAQETSRITDRYRAILRAVEGTLAQLNETVDPGIRGAGSPLAAGRRSTVHQEGPAPAVQEDAPVGAPVRGGSN